MRELVVISGKGGTGKTSLLASLALLARRAVVVDCDVDAADLHLLLGPTVRQRELFFSGHEAVVDTVACSACGLCGEACHAGAVAVSDGRAAVDPLLCEGCGLCVRLCPEQAIGFHPRLCGEWFVSDTAVGPMVHARLEPGGESSGRLVTLLRREARRIADETGHQLVLIDGPPGIGCPVIASLSGATDLVAITEPTRSGLHDLERLLELAAHFHVPASVCVNKWDLSPALTAAIERRSIELGETVIGRIPYDRSVTDAQVVGQPVVTQGGAAADAIRAVWRALGAAEVEVCETGPTERLSGRGP